MFIKYTCFFVYEKKNCVYREEKHLTKNSLSILCKFHNLHINRRTINLKFQDFDKETKENTINFDF